MLKIMFVDDEPAVRAGLKKSFDWNKLGFEVVAEAGDGIEAMERFKQTHPNVIIADICMAKKDGLEFIAELKALAPHVEVIIFSGYPDFNYAKAAIESGAFAYLLKPLKIREFLTTLENVKAKIQNDQVLTRERFLFHLLQHNPPSKETIDGLSKKYGLYIPDSWYFIATIQPDSPSGSFEPEIYDKLGERLRKQLLSSYRALICQPQHDHLTLLCFCENDKVQDTICGIISEVKESLSQQCGVTFTIGVSRLFRSITRVHDAYLESLFAVSQKALHGYGCVIHYNESTDKISDKNQLSALFLTSSDLEDLLEGLKILNRPMVDRALKSYFAKLRQLKNVNINTIKNAVSALAMQIIHTCAPNAEAVSLIFGSIPIPAEELGNMDLISDIENYILSMVDSVFDHAGVRVPRTHSKLVRDVQTYIMYNYHLPITIETIAENLHVDRYHLMHTFKNETGTTINEFITRHRINTAVTLLQDGNHRIADISRNVGFRDANYFSKVFKKQTGYLPSDYPGSPEV